ncbi:ATP-dependent zinc metalloprotease FtsH [mine drainage metagenome]|uniref:ATP-dependent zinc metalloprotease FtsH n=1 Tax=mine drainage metagenome TaxID=410659 RepID=A0A1J5PJ98_9ZZZZ
MEASLIQRIAAHEAGHAIICAKLGLGRVRALRLTPSGGQAEVDLRPTAGLREDIDALLIYQLAGRAAERMICGNASGGAGGPSDSDLARATKTAIAAEVSLGLAKTLVWQPADSTALKDPALRARIDKRLRSAEARAVALLRDDRERLERLAEALADERLLEGEALKWLLAAPLPDPEAHHEPARQS